MPLSGSLPRLGFKILKDPIREPDGAKRPSATTNIVPGPLGQTGPKAAGGACSARSIFGKLLSRLSGFSSRTPRQHRAFRQAFLKNQRGACSARSICEKLLSQLSGFSSRTPRQPRAFRQAFLENQRWGESILKFREGLTVSIW